VSRARWLLAWRLATFSALFAALRAFLALALLVAGRPTGPAWATAAWAGLAAAMGWLALHANGRRKALLREEMPSPPGPAPGP
jgi:hypothetical protein